jgi:hypothetical protein
MSSASAHRHIAVVNMDKRALFATRPDETISLSSMLRNCQLDEHKTAGGGEPSPKLGRTARRYGGRTRECGSNPPSSEALEEANPREASRRIRARQKLRYYRQFQKNDRRKKKARDAGRGRPDYCQGSPHRLKVEQGVRPPGAGDLATKVKASRGSLARAYADTERLRH